MDDEIKALAEVGAALGDPARAAMVLALMDGSARPAGDLQLQANVSASSASAHLARLTESGVLTATRQGRHRLYRLRSAPVAHAVEALRLVAAPRVAVRSLARSAANPFAFARTCYDHLAGRLGVAVTDGLCRMGCLHANAGNLELTADGQIWLMRLGIDAQTLVAARRPLALACLDYTERRPHLAGAVGAALLQHFLGLQWLVRGRLPRALRLTERGRVELGHIFHLELTQGGELRPRR
ncbi:MAG: ArsR/SmtB family transcription factor [Terriglobales bacterium]